MTTRIILLFAFIAFSLLSADAANGGNDLPPTSTPAPSAPASSKITLWDGLTKPEGNGRTFVGHTPGIAESSVAAVPGEAAGSKKQMLQWRITGKDWIMMAWGGLGPKGGYPLQGSLFLTIRLKVVGPQPPPELQLRVQASSEDEGTTANFVELGHYSDHLMDGQWHDIRVPLVDIYRPHPVGHAIDQFQLGLITGSPIDCTVLIDAVSLDR